MKICTASTCFSLDIFLVRLSKYCLSDPSATRAGGMRSRPYWAVDSVLTAGYLGPYDTVWHRTCDSGKPACNCVNGSPRPRVTQLGHKLWRYQRFFLRKGQSLARCFAPCCFPLDVEGSYYYWRQLVLFLVKGWAVGITTMK